MYGSARFCGEPRTGSSVKLHTPWEDCNRRKGNPPALPSAVVGIWHMHGQCVIMNAGGNQDDGKG